MKPRVPGFAELAAKTVVAHTVSYMLMGILAYFFLDYAERFSRPEMACWMRPTTDVMVMAGPLFQPIRGLIFALVFFPLRGILFGGSHGWLLTWWTLTALGILSTFGPAPGSVEGMIYTVIPVADQLVGLLEVVPQALLLSAILSFWVNRPGSRWLTGVMVVVFSVTLALPALGLLVAPQ
jgi:hypothetical protein